MASAASNARILTTDGKSDTTTKAKTFGLTVKDRQSTTIPNMTQLSIIPSTAAGTMQNHRFVLGSTLTGTAVSSSTNAIGPTGPSSNGSTITIVPDLTLVSTRIYQFIAYLTIVTQPAVDNTFLTGHYTITGAAKGVALIGGGYGYRLDTICSESTLDTYIDETCITLGVNGTPGFVITVTPKVNIIYSIDLVADVTINSALFSV